MKAKKIEKEGMIWVSISHDDGELRMIYDFDSIAQMKEIGELLVGLADK